MTDERPTITSLRAEDGVYVFAVRALDSANRLQEFKGLAEASIAAARYALFLTPRAWLPVVFG
jgi:hypothetical protein